MPYLYAIKNQKILNILQARIGDYFALSKPGIASVVTMTTAAGWILAVRTGTAGSADVSLFLHTILGTALVAFGAGSLNMLLEIEPDSLMNRTRSRPLPSGRVEPLESLILGTFCASIGIVHLAAMVNIFSSLIASLCLMLYLVFYTPMKKSTPFCTVVGAVSGALPPMIGWSAGKGFPSLAGWSLFLILFVWQFPHLLALSWIYREDYERAGFRMAPVADDRGVQTSRNSLISTLAILPASLVPYLAGLCGFWYLCFSMALWGMMFSSALNFFFRKSVPAAKKLFFSSVLYIPLILLGMLCLPR